MIVRAPKRVGAPRRPRDAVPGPVRLVLVLLVVGLVAAGCSGGSGAASSGANRRPHAISTTAASTTTTTAPGSSPLPIDVAHAVGVATETYVDPSRSTSPNGDFPGAPSRTFPTTIWYPAAGDPGGAATAGAAPDAARGPYPIVVFSHGYAVTPDFYAALLTRWAAAGYVVVAPAYPILSGTPGGASHTDYNKTLTDVRFVITAMSRTFGAGGRFAGLGDLNRIGTAGQSDGEVIAFSAGFLECCRDPRVKAVIAMAGNLGNANNPARRNSGIPILHIVGKFDELQPYDDAVQWDRDNLTAPRWTMSLLRGDHASPYTRANDASFPAVVDATIAFLDGALKRHPERFGRLNELAAESPALVAIET